MGICFRDNIEFVFNILQSYIIFCFYFPFKGWDGIESNETLTWSFSGGLFYSITVITTIGKVNSIFESME